MCLGCKMVIHGKSFAVEYLQILHTACLVPVVKLHKHLIFNVIYISFLINNVLNHLIKYSLVVHILKLTIKSVMTRFWTTIPNRWNHMLTSNNNNSSHQLNLTCDLKLLSKIWCMTSKLLCITVIGGELSCMSVDIYSYLQLPIYTWQPYRQLYIPAYLSSGSYSCIYVWLYNSNSFMQFCDHLDIHDSFMWQLN